MKNNITILILLITALCHAQTPGIIDTTFGINGYTTVNPTTFDDGLAAIALQQDGKILALGRSYLGNSEFDFSLCRLNSDGSIDTGYGISGINDGSDVPNGYPTRLLLQPDGKAIATGSSSGESAVIIRYNTDGSLDNTFGLEGKVYFNYSSSELEMIRDVKLLPDGRIMTVGYILQNNIAALIFIRLNTDGSLDTTFNTTGYKIKQIAPGKSASVVSLIVQPDGKYVAAGTITTPGVTYNSGDIFITRINADGSNDNTFGTSSSALFNIYNGDYLTDFILLSDGSYLTYGHALNDFGLATDPQGGVFLMNITAQGELSATFGTNGIVLNDFINAPDSQTEYTNKILKGPDGKLYLSGCYRTTYSFTSYKGFIACVNSDGSINTDFGDGGVRSFNYEMNTVSQFIFDNQNNILAGGTEHFQDDKFKFSRLNTGMTLSLNNTTDNKYISIYPNPSTDYVKANLDGYFVIYDFLGRQVKSGQIYAGQDIDLNSISKGTYVFELHHKYKSYKCKLVKQ